ncbi:MAG TPA: LCP family protein [Actinomycetota bacterium]|nr:LCP family protein [Actinomycetota bacterium]
MLVGSDSREGLTEEEQQSFGADDVGGERADTLILAHIDPAANTIVMVQFPRDLYVPISGVGNGKINGALEPGLNTLVRTMEDVTGVPIHHYIQVNIAGFRDVVDAIGGVGVCITETIPFDPQTGIEITEEELGIVEFDGERALRFVRSREFETGDFERIENQQKFLSAAIDKITAVGTFFNPARIMGLYRAVGDNLQLSEGTGIRKLVDIAQRLQDFDPTRYEAYIVPTAGYAENEAGSVILPDASAMEIMFAAIANNESPSEADGVPDVDPASIRVGVYNGTAIAGHAESSAAAIQEALTVNGRTVAIGDIGALGRTDFRQTVVRYEAGYEEAAELVAAGLPGAVVQQGSTPAGVDVAVVAGEHFETRRVIQLDPLDLPEGGALPAICR